MTRVLTAALGIALLLGVTLAAPSWVFRGFVLLVAALALDEFLRMVAANGSARPGRWLILPGVAVTLAFSLGAGAVVYALTLQLLLLGAVSISGGRSGGHLEYISYGTMGTLYACVLPGFFFLLSPAALWILLVTVWAGDAAAYYGGRLLGRRPLAPVLSPNKTVEGALAGGLASLIGGTLLAARFLDAPAVLLAGICLATGVAGPVGDLVESGMKRAAGIKDTARLLPGHGGVLDRIDSLLFAAPVFHLLLLWTL
jgi:phosphatidate cytidylyltransferase